MGSHSRRNPTANLVGDRQDNNYLTNLLRGNCRRQEEYLQAPPVLSYNREPLDTGRFVFNVITHSHHHSRAGITGMEF